MKKVLAAKAEELIEFDPQELTWWEQSSDSKKLSSGLHIHPK